MSINVNAISAYVDRLVVKNGSVIGVMGDNGFFPGDAVVLAAGCDVNAILERSHLPTVSSLKIIPGRTLLFRSLPRYITGEVYRLPDEGLGVSIVMKGHTGIVSLHGLSQVSDSEFLETGISLAR